MVVASSLGDFLRRIAFDAVSHGYVRYVLRRIPAGKDPVAVDGKLDLAYGITRCRTTRMHRRRQGFANVVGVRWGHWFALLASEGGHPAFERLRSYDIRTAPLHFGGYSVGVSGGRGSVRLARSRAQAVSHRVLALALRDKQVVEEKLAALPYYRFPGVMAQRQALIVALNARRKPAGLKPVVDVPPQNVRSVVRRRYGSKAAPKQR